MYATCKTDESNNMHSMEIINFPLWKWCDVTQNKIEVDTLRLTTNKFTKKKKI